MVDCDRHGDGPDGVAALSAIDLPPHQSVTTITNGGQQHFFRQPAPRIRFAAFEGIQVLGDGRLVKAYAIEPFVTPAPVLPKDLLDRLPKAQVAKGNGASIKPHHGPLIAGVGRIPKLLYSEVLRLVPLSDKVTRHHQRRVIGILSIVTQRREGQGRNGALNVAAFCFRELIGIVSRDAAERLLFGAAQACGYVAKDGDRAAMATIRSGLGSTIGGPCVGLSNEGECRD